MKDETMKPDLKLIHSKDKLFTDVIGDLAVREEKARLALEKKERAVEALAIKIAEDDIWMLHTNRGTTLWMMIGGERKDLNDKAFMNRYNEIFCDLDFGYACRVMKEADREVCRLVKDWTTVTGGIKNGSGSLNLMIKNFCPMAPEGEGETDPDVEMLLFNNTSADGPDGLKSLERHILNKYEHPENLTLPSAIFSQEDGGGGKTTLCEVLLGETVFGGSWRKSTMEELTGKNNAVLGEGAALIYCGEAAYSKGDNDRLKDNIGSNKITVKRLYRDPVTVAPTAWLTFASNYETGSAMLADGKDVDRRYSMWGGEFSFADAIACRDGVSVDEARTYIHDVVIEKLKDKKMVGKWLRYLKDKHGEVINVEAFHGATYKACAAAQANTSVAETLRDIFEDRDFKIITINWLLDILWERNKVDLRGHKNYSIRGEIKAVAAKIAREDGKKIEFEEGKQVYLTHAERRKRDIFKLSGFESSKEHPLNRLCSHLGYLDAKGNFLFQTNFLAKKD